MSKKLDGKPTKTYTGRVVYTRKRHFFTQKDVMRILYNMHDDNHYDIFWELFSLLNLEFRIIMDSIAFADDLRNFFTSVLRSIFDNFISPSLWKVGWNIFDALRQVGIIFPYESE